MVKLKKQITNGRIVANVKVARNHYIMNIEAPQLARSARAGQFVNIKVQEKTTDPLLRVPLGVHRINKNGISLLYKVLGTGTELLSLKKKGEVVSVLGPLGKGFDLSFLDEDKKRAAVIISGGHGIAPLYALAEEIIKKKARVDFFIGASTKNHILCTEELKKLGVKLHVATEDGTRGAKGYVTCLLPEYLKKISDENNKPSVYACGPRAMLAAVSEEVHRIGLNAQVSLDEYMACGIGACLGCAVKTHDGYKMVCSDGPVFDSREIKWEHAGVC